MAYRSIAKVSVAQVKPGMILGTDICTPEGAVLLARKTIMTGYAIARLRNWSIEYVNVVIGRHQSEPQTKPVHDHSLEDVAFFNMYIHSVDTIGTLFDEMCTSKKVPLLEFQTIAEGILEQVLQVQGVLNRLRQVKSGDEYTYNHSLNVGIYAVLIGSWLEYDEKMLRQLAMAGLLHDVGKAKIPPAILQKPASLTSEEFDVIKKHTLYGYQLVNNTAGLSRQVAMAVLQHHEREDGTGYPLKLNSQQIHPLAKIIAVADVYDAVTSNRVYRAKKPPYMAADIIMEESFKKLDPVVVQKFLERITTYYFADKVRLNTGVIGTIISIDPLRPTRPLIQTEDGFIDLQTAPTLQIVEVL